MGRNQHFLDGAAPHVTGQLALFGKNARKGMSASDAAKASPPESSGPGVTRVPHAQGQEPLFAGVVKGTGRPVDKEGRLIGEASKQEAYERAQAAYLEAKGSVAPTGTSGGKGAGNAQTVVPDLRTGASRDDLSGAPKPRPNIQGGKSSRRKGYGGRAASTGGVVTTPGKAAVGTTTKWANTQEAALGMIADLPEEERAAMVAKHFDPSTGKIRRNPDGSFPFGSSPEEIVSTFREQHQEIYDKHHKQTSVKTDDAEVTAPHRQVREMVREHIKSTMVDEKGAPTHPFVHEDGTVWADHDIDAALGYVKGDEKVDDPTKPSGTRSMAMPVAPNSGVNLPDADAAETKFHQTDETGTPIPERNKKTGEMRVVSRSTGVQGAIPNGKFRASQWTMTGKPTEPGPNAPLPIVTSEDGTPVLDPAKVQAGAGRALEERARTHKQVRRTQQQKEAELSASLGADKKDIYLRPTAPDSRPTGKPSEAVRHEANEATGQDAAARMFVLNPKIRTNTEHKHDDAQYEKGEFVGSPLKTPEQRDEHLKQVGAERSDPRFLQDQVHFHALAKRSAPAVDETPDMPIDQRRIEIDPEHHAAVKAIAEDRTHPLHEHAKRTLAALDRVDLTGYVGRTPAQIISDGVQSQQAVNRVGGAVLSGAEQLGTSPILPSAPHPDTPAPTVVPRNAPPTGATPAELQRRVAHDQDTADTGRTVPVDNDPHLQKFSPKKPPKGKTEDL